jgi:uncharacterized membrane protein
LLLFMFVTYVSLLPLLSRYVYDTNTHTHTQILINFALLLLMTWGVLLFGFQDIRVLLMR